MFPQNGVLLDNELKDELIGLGKDPEFIEMLMNEEQEYFYIRETDRFISSPQIF